MKYFIIFLLLFSMSCYGMEFGKYKYSKYLGIQQQIKNQQMAELRRQRLYNQNPARNIRYQRYPNQYPNIERSNYSHYSNLQRYSPQYYQLRYGN